jgi:cobalt-precorrin-6B (C15)-methyltransferase
VKDLDFIRGSAPMTKEEVRAIVVSKLSLREAYGLLDIGAGTGSISIEAKLTYPHLQVIALEQHEESCELIQKNCEKFQVRDLKVIAERAPCEIVTKGINRFFIGGSEGALKDILEWIITLAPSGIVVATAITLETQQRLIEELTKAPFRGAHFTYVQVNQVAELGTSYYMKPQNPIFIACAEFS